MTKFDETKKVIAIVREKSDAAIIFCSFGKDSLVTLDLVYPQFSRIICVFMYFVKNLEHVTRWMNWAKAKYPRIEFLEVPHWNLTYILRGGLYCVPDPHVKLMKLADVVHSVRLKTGVYYTFLGMKKSDGMNRNLMLKGYESQNYENKGFVYPLADWTQKDVLAYMKMNVLPQPIRYSSKASSGIGFNLECFLWLRKNFPGDLQKIYTVFPMSERILWEYDNKK